MPLIHRLVNQPAPGHYAPRTDQQYNPVSGTARKPTRSLRRIVSK